MASGVMPTQSITHTHTRHTRIHPPTISVVDWATCKLALDAFLPVAVGRSVGLVCVDLPACLFLGLPHSSIAQGESKREREEQERVR